MKKTIISIEVQEYRGKEATIVRGERNNQTINLCLPLRRTKKTTQLSARHLQCHFSLLKSHFTPPKRDFIMFNGHITHAFTLL